MTPGLFLFLRKVATVESLALKYRPRTFEDVVGQRAVQVVLKQMVLKQEVPHALLFDGSRGCGKTTTARILAAALNCEQQPGPCAVCSSCVAVAEQTSLALLEVDAASNGLVEDIRNLRQVVRYSSGADKRVVVLDEAHSMSREAFNALLKTLEEPPDDTVFILLTTEPRRILDTVVSRCMNFTFSRISVADMVGRLREICRQESLDVQDDLLFVIAERADGGMRDAVMTLDQVTRVGIRTAADFLELLGVQDFGPTLVACLAVAGGKEGLARAYGVADEQWARTGDPLAVIAALTSTLRDVLVLHGGGTITAQGKALEERRALAQRVPAYRIFAALRVLWEVRSKLRVGGDRKTDLDLAVVALADAFGMGLSAPVASSAPARRMTLAEMGTPR